VKGIIQIHKKEYKTVALRVTEFLASPTHKEWSIETDLISDGTNVVMKSTIKDVDGRIRGTGYAEEVRGSTNINKTSAMENCETSAIGRALASVGFAGTEYASANEVTDAILQQAKIEATEQANIKSDKKLQDLVDYNHMVANHWLIIVQIKESISQYYIANDVEHLKTAAEEYSQLSHSEQLFLWKSTRDGGVFSPYERKIIKSDEWPNIPSRDLDDPILDVAI
jgi:hypothetical protein